jgi:hypothetical protein
LVRREKKISDYNSHDLHMWFSAMYEAKFGKPYNSKTFRGLELKALKALTEKYDPIEILCAIKTFIDNNDATVHVKYFTAGFDYYKPNTGRPDIYWYVVLRGDSEMKLLWSKYIILEAKWFPHAKTDIKKEAMLQKLEKFYAQERKKEPQIEEASRLYAKKGV